MDCEKCGGYVVEVTEQGEDGDYLDCLRNDSIESLTPPAGEEEGMRLGWRAAYYWCCFLNELQLPWQTYLRLCRLVKL